VSLSVPAFTSGTGDINTCVSEMILDCSPQSCSVCELTTEESNSSPAHTIIPHRDCGSMCSITFPLVEFQQEASRVPESAIMAKRYLFPNVKNATSIRWRYKFWDGFVNSRKSFNYLK
jgi:hypothetical protein